MTSSHLYVLLNRLYVSVCSNESLNHQYRHYLQLVESLELLWAEQWFQFLDFVQVTNNDPNIDQQQYQVPLNQDIHDFGMVTTKPAKKRFFSRIKSVSFCLQLSVYKIPQRCQWPDVSLHMHLARCRVFLAVESSSTNGGIMRSTISSLQLRVCICQTYQPKNLTKIIFHKTKRNDFKLDFLSAAKQMPAKINKRIDK